MSEPPTIGLVELARARAALGKIGGERVQRQIFLCALSDKQKCCSREDGARAWNYLKRRLKELGLVGQAVQRTKADCLQVCEAGPIAVVWPDGREPVIRHTPHAFEATF